MLCAYLDSSTVEPIGARILSVAGLFGEAVPWQEFGLRWQEILNPEAIEYFRMSEFENRVGKYAGWSNDKRVEFIKSLVDALRIAKPLATGCQVDLDAYDGLTEIEKKSLGSPYCLGAQWAIRYVAKTLRRVPPGEMVAYVFEHGDPGRGELQSTFATASARYRDKMRLASLDFAGKELPQLQAADLMAYEYCKDALRTHGFDDRPMRLIAQALEEVSVPTPYFFGEESLKGIAELMAKGFDPLAPVW